MLLCIFTNGVGWSRYYHRRLIKYSCFSGFQIKKKTLLKLELLVLSPVWNIVTKVSEDSYVGDETFSWLKIRDWTWNRTLRQTVREREREPTSSHLVTKNHPIMSFILIDVFCGLAVTYTWRAENGKRGPCSPDPYKSLSCAKRVPRD